MEPKKRHWSRRLALQALYQWQISGHKVEELLGQYVEDDNWGKADKDYFVDLVTSSINQNEDLTKTRDSIRQRNEDGRGARTYNIF